MSVKEENLRKFNAILTAVLGITEEQIMDRLAPEDVESWDSFNGLVIASELETTFSVSFTTEEVTGVKNVGDMKTVLRNHRIDI
jgi:acyl carrier protein